MTAYLIVGAVAAVAFLIPMALGVSEMRRLALAALFIAAPLEVYRTETAIGNVSVFRVVLAVAIFIAVRRRGCELLSLVRQPIPLTAAGLLVMMALSLVFVSENRTLARAVLGQGGAVYLAAITTALLAQGIPLRSILRLACLGAALPLLAAAAQGFYAHGGETVSLPLLSHLPAAPGLEVTRAEALYLGDEGVRLKGTFGDPNHFAVWLVFMLAASIAAAPAWFGARRTMSVAGLIWCAGIFTVLVATYSRSGWLCLAVAAGLALVFVTTSANGRRLLRARRGWATAALLLCVVAVVPLAPKIVQRLDNDRSANRISNESHARTTRVATDEFLARPLTGIGLSDLGPRLGQPQRTSGAHSSYLTVASELGFPGLLAAVVLLILVATALFSAARTGWEDNLARLGVFCAYVGFVVANTFYDLFWDDFHWLFVGVALAIAASSSRGEERLREGADGPDAERRTAERTRSASLT